MKESPALADQPQFLEQLKQIPAFQPFSDEILRDILRMTRIRRYAPGEYIIKEGHQDSRLFVLVRGSVDVFKGDTALTRLKRSGDIFGEMGVIDGAPRSASVVACDDCLCLTLDAAEADRMGPEKRDTFFSILYRLCAELLASRLRLTNELLQQTRSELDAVMGEVDTLKRRKQTIITPYGTRTIG